MTRRENRSLVTWSRPLTPTRSDRDLGTYVTDALGEFVVAYYVDVTTPDTEHNLHFRVRGPTIAEAVEVTGRIKTDSSAAVSVRVPLPSVDPTLQQVRESGHMDVLGEFLDMLEQKHAIRSLADIRRVGGLSRIAARARPGLRLYAPPGCSRRSRSLVQ